MDEQVKARNEVLMAAYVAHEALRVLERTIQRHDAAPIGEDAALLATGLRARIQPILGYMEGRLLPFERTQEAVMVAMIRSYVDAATEAETAYFAALPRSGEEFESAERRDWLWAAAESIRGELSWLRAEGEMCRLREWPEWVGKDFVSRMNGETPINSPPVVP